MGSLVLDRFRLEEELGSGAFGTVSRAWDDRLRRDVAIKAIPVGSAGPERVMREAHAAARLSHPGIVQLYEIGMEDGVAFLVTELVEGVDLGRALALGHLSDRDLADLGADLCEALDHAHSRGVVHRDIKPANILIAEPDRRPKLMDFGVARLTDEAGLTATGDVVGTLAYMSPEQAEGLAVGPETDVYALSLVLYEALCGENPNRRRTPAETVRAIGAQPPPLASRRSDLPEALTDAIDSGLDPDPDLRLGFEQLGGALEGSLRWLDGTAPSRCPGRSAPTRGLAGAVGRLPSRAAFTALLVATAAAAILLGDQPGVAALVMVVGLPLAGLLRSTGPVFLVPAAAPLLGLAGIGALYPALAGLARTWQDRVILALAGVIVTIATQAALARDLGLGSTPAADARWQSSAPSALQIVPDSIIAEPRLLVTAAAWVAAAAVVGILVAPLRAWAGGGDRSVG